MTRSRRKAKTLLMQLLEIRFGGREVETLMVEAFQQHGTEHAAAVQLGITQQTFNAWKYRLGIAEQIAALTVEPPHAPRFNDEN